MDARKKQVYDFLVANNLLPEEFQITKYDTEDGLTDVEEKFMLDAFIGGDDAYAVIKDSDTKEEIVIFLTDEGMRNYVENILESGDEPLEEVLTLLRDLSGYNYEGVYEEWRMSIQEAGDTKYSIVKQGSFDKRASTMNIIKHAAGTGIGPYRRGRVLTEVSGLQPGQLLVWEAIVFKAVNLVKVTEVFDEKFYGIIVKPDNPVEKAKASDEEFVVYSHDLEKGEWYLALEPAPSEVMPAAEEAAPAPEKGPEAPAAPEKAPAAPEGAEGPAEGAPATAEPTPEPKKGAGLKSPVKQTMDYGTPEKKAAKNPRYIFFYEENKPVAMWGEGLVKATVDGEEVSVDSALESLTADISEDVSPLVGSLVSIYVGNATYSTYDILVDYSMDDILAQPKEDGVEMTEDGVDKEIDRISDFLNQNTDVRALTAEAPAEETTASKKTAADEERNPSIATTYEIWDEESDEIGETDDKGWIDEEGESMLPDEFDDEDTTIVSKAVEFLQKNGVNHPSSMPLVPGRTWYTNDNYNENFEKGSTEQRSYFLSGFTPEEEQEIFNQMTGKTASVSKTAYGEEPATALERKDNSSEPLRKEDMVIQKTAEEGDEEMTSFASYQTSRATVDLPEETVTATKEVAADYDHFFDFDDKNFGRTASNDFIGSAGSTQSLVAGLLANIESLASAPGGSGDDGAAYDLAEGRDFTGVDEHMATASVEEYLNGKAVSFASLEDFAGFVEDIYGIKRASKSRVVEAAWHNDDAPALVSFIKQNAKKDELSA